jgi:hypothetical protein
MLKTLLLFCVLSAVAAFEAVPVTLDNYGYHTT